MFGFYLNDITIIGNGPIVILILFMSGAVGASCGILLSISDDIKFVSLFTCLFNQIIFFLCGAMWPLEGQHSILRGCSKILPITMAAISMRDVMIRGYGIFDKSVVIAILVLVAWVTGSVLLAYNVVKKKKFSNI